MKEKKSDKAKALFLAGNLKGALAIYKTFPHGFTREEKRAIEIAHGALSGQQAFYKSINIDTEEMITSAKAIITNKFIH